MRGVVVIISFLLLASEFHPLQARTKWYKETRDAIYLDTMLLRLTYLKTFRETREDSTYKKDIYYLSLGTEVSAFVTAAWDYAKKQTDQYFANNPFALQEISQEKYMTSIRNQYSCEQEEYYSNFPNMGQLTLFTAFLKVPCGPWYYYSEPMETIEWESEDGDSIVCGYSCHCSSTTFRGVKWRVWYTLDIPMQEGPWKLRGLPGLIMKATDNRGDFDFTAIEVSKSGGLIHHPVLNYERISPRQYWDYMVLKYKDRPRLLRLFYGAERTEAFMEQMSRYMNVSIKTENKTACLMEIRP